jgi:hypothetical protein
LCAGVISGLIIRITGKKELAYQDTDEFLEESVSVTAES